MPSAEDIAKAVWEYDADKATTGTQTAGGLLLTETRRSDATTNKQLPAMALAVAQLAAQVRELTGKDVVDEGVIVAGVLAGLDPEAIAAAVAAALPADQAQRVADELASRLAA